MFKREDLALAIQNLRGRRSQMDVSKRAGISISHWNQIERGRRSPRRDKFELIAQGLGVTSEQLEEQVWRARCARVRQARLGDDDGTTTLSNNIGLNSDGTYPAHRGSDLGVAEGPVIPERLLQPEVREAVDSAFLAFAKLVALCLEQDSTGAGDRSSPPDSASSATRAGEEGAAGV